MRRNVYDVPKWHLIQHREERGLPLPATIDPPLRRLEDELFERLFAGDCERLPDGATTAAVRAWADRIHDTCSALPQFERLGAECRGDAAAAASAVESLLQELGALPPLDAPPPAAAPGSSRDPLRRPLLAACASAARAVEHLRDASDGLAGVALGRGTGTGTERGRGRTDPKAKHLARRLRDDERLLRIALLAGRMKRIAASKRRSRVKHGADELSDIEQGDDLARLLPAELARLGSPRRRLDFMRSLLERQALQYRLTGSDTLGRGPLVVLLDKSGSMEEDGGLKDVWATALALALLERAQVERRAFALVDYNSRPFHQEVVRPGEALPEEALFVACGGGTSIAAALERGLDIVAAGTEPLRKADLVLVSDGEDDDTVKAPELRSRAAGLGVSIFGLAIGFPGDALGPWCDEAQGVTDLATLAPKVASALF